MFWLPFNNLMKKFFVEQTDEMNRKSFTYAEKKQGNVLTTLLLAELRTPFA